MAISKVELKNADGSTQVLVDLTGDTVTAASLEEGKTAHDAKGDVVTGTMLNTGTGEYVWRKYDVVTYTITKTRIGSTKPSDCGSTKYSNYMIVDGGFSLYLSGAQYSGYYYISGQTSNPKEIYYDSYGYPNHTYYRWTLEECDPTKGDNFYGYVSDASSDAYPTNGEQGGYWYVKVEEGTGATTPNLQSKTVTPSASTQTVKPDSSYDGLSQVTVNGDADLIASNIRSGVNIFGVNGTYTGSGSSGSSDNNVEAYHITSTSTPITFKRTDGTIKVFGYGYGQSGYTSTTYAFNGSGYYKGSSWNSPTHTNVSWSLDSSGVLQGLPTVSQIDVIVTKGI